MENSVLFWVTNLIVNSLLLVSGTTFPCINQEPIQETAYVGAYEVHFPSSMVAQPTQCRWRISAYRKDYVISLDFIDVNLTENSRDGTCLELVTVYDGSDVTDNVLTTFCGQEDPSFVSSSRDTLVVFSSNETLVAGGRFRLRYKAVKDRANNDDSSQILRIAFGGFIGAIAFILICSGAIRKYNKGRPHSSVFAFFGRHRVNSSAQPAGNGRGAMEARGTTPGALQGPRGQERLSFRKRLSDFFQDMVMKLSPRRLDIESSTSDSSDYSSSLHPQTGPRRNNRFGRRSTSLTSCTDATHISQARSSSSNNDSDFDPSSMSHIHLDGHENFGYQSIPVSSFTSDPAAVKPPTYEDCINTVNPLHLHHHSVQAFYNRAFDLKDEGCPDMFSPPPPYSEIIPDNPTHPSAILPHGQAVGECPGIDQQLERVASGGGTNGSHMYPDYRCHSQHPLNIGIGNSLTPVSILQSSDALTAPEGVRKPEAESKILDVLEASPSPEGAVQPNHLSASNPHQPTAEGLVAANPTTAPLALLRRSGFISTLPGEPHTIFGSAPEPDHRQKPCPKGTRADRKSWTLKPPDDLFSELATAQCSDTDQLFVNDSFFHGAPCCDDMEVVSSVSASNRIQSTEDSTQAPEADSDRQTNFETPDGNNDSTGQRLNIDGLDDVGEGHNA
ncbi:unnamed protein product [Lymnaea stagnalis]|uniref:CUB domain-containing protein n=1 Tax=Lymnaea stagnalis TaxID=6523 RepID=A0AAV2HYN1_LYMST